MAKSTPAEIQIWYDNSGGTLVDISQFVQSFNGIEIENLIEETHTFGDSFEENTPIGIGRVTNITLEGSVRRRRGRSERAVRRRSPDEPELAHAYVSRGLGERQEHHA
jgi:hypothetical protein